MRLRKRYDFVLAVTILIGTLGMPSISFSADFTVIAQKDVPANSLTKSELQAIFLGEKVKWDHKHRIKVAVPDEGSQARALLPGVVGKTPAQFDNHWLKLAYTGRAMLPPAFADVSKLVNYVATQQGAVSFVPSGQAADSVKIISIK